MKRCERCLTPSVIKVFGALRDARRPLTRVEIRAATWLAARTIGLALETLEDMSFVKRRVNFEDMRQPMWEAIV
jgi:DNA-binding transcriptional regulator GbsR (MarR family)